VIVLDWQERTARDLSHRVTAIFGRGLIGRAIQGAIESGNAPGVTHFPFAWEDRSARAHQLDAVASHIRRSCQRFPATQIDIVWSAGRAGFAATEGDFQHEQQSFESVVAMTMGLQEVADASRLRFHLVSSAGGLFEAQRNVSLLSVPNPLRPYGLAKLEQEKILVERAKDITRFVYRPSSAYGFNNRGGRAGLIVTLIQAAINNKTAHIYGTKETLRDFVFADDIGNFIALQITETDPTSQTYLLASGKPTSMMEVIGLIERVLDRRLLLQFALGGNNTSSNTFRTDAHPAGWRPTQLETGVRKTATRIRNNFIYTPRRTS
jgi:nucleoside-diphosphate-sugar epimerase